MVHLSPARKLQPLMGGPHWDLLTAYLAVEKDRLVTRLFKCREDELKSIQGELLAIQRLIDMPLSLNAEIKTVQRA